MKKMEYGFENYGSKHDKFQKSYSGSFAEITEQAKLLADTIRHSPEFMEYAAAKEQLDSDEMNKKVLHELREQQFNFQFSSQDDDLEKKARFLNEMYMAVSLNPVISDYLNAEYRFGLVVEELKKAFDGIFAFEDGFDFESTLRSKYQN